MENIKTTAEIIQEIEQLIKREPLFHKPIDDHNVMLQINPRLVELCLLLPEEGLTPELQRCREFCYKITHPETPENDN